MNEIAATNDVPLSKYEVVPKSPPKKKGPSWSGTSVPVSVTNMIIDIYRGSCQGFDTEKEQCFFKHFFPEELKTVIESVLNTTSQKLSWCCMILILN